MPDGSFSDIAEELANAGTSFGDVMDNADHGERSYRPLPDAKPADEPDPYDGGQESLRKLATERAAEELPLIEREYRRNGGDGRKYGLEYTVKPERAAQDLTDSRAQEAKQAETQDDRELAEALNTLRAQEAPPAGYTEPVAEVPQPQPETSEFHEGAHDPEMAKLYENPKYREAIQKDAAAIEAERQRYAQAVTGASRLAAAMVADSIPELRGLGLTAEQLPAAFETIARKDPARGQQIAANMQRLDSLHMASVQEQARDFQKNRDEQNRLFEVSIKDEPPELVKEVKADAMTFLSRTYGVPMEALAHASRTNPNFHSVLFQRMTYDLTKQDRTKRGLERAKVRQIPSVQRPGIAPDRPDAGERDRATLWQRLNSVGGNVGTRGVKNGAAIVSARRAARG